MKLYKGSVITEDARAFTMVSIIIQDTPITLVMQSAILVAVRILHLRHMKVLESYMCCCAGGVSPLPLAGHDLCTMDFVKVAKWAPSGSAQGPAQQQG